MEQNSNYRVLSNVCVSCGVRIPDIDFEIKPAMRETYGLFLVPAESFSCLPLARLCWKDKGSRIPDRSSRHIHIPVMTE